MRSSRLFEVEEVGVYHEHWRARNHRDAAQRAAEHAQEIGVSLSEIEVSSMTAPEGGNDGLVYVNNDAHSYAVAGNRLTRVKGGPGEKLV